MILLLIKKSATNYYIFGKQDGDYRLLSPNFIHNSGFGGYNDFPNSVKNTKYIKSSRKDFLIDNCRNYGWDRINNIANNILNEDEIKQFTKTVLYPYFTNHQNAKTMVEEQLEDFKKRIALQRYQSYFNMWLSYHMYFKQIIIQFCQILANTKFQIFPSIIKY